MSKQKEQTTAHSSLIPNTIEEYLKEASGDRGEFFSDRGSTQPIRIKLHSFL